MVKRLITTSALLLSLAAPAVAAEQTVTLKVDNMSCALCPITVKKSLAQVSGVDAVTVSLEEETATVTFDDAKTSAAALVEATTNAGYPSKVTP